MSRAVEELQAVIEEPDLYKRRKAMKEWARRFMFEGKVEQLIHNDELAVLTAIERNLFLAKVGDGLIRALLGSVRSLSPTLIDVGVGPAAKGSVYHASITILSPDELPADPEKASHLTVVK